MGDNVENAEGGGNPGYEVAPGHDSGFLQNSNVTTLSDLLNQTDGDIDDDLVSDYDEGQSQPQLFLTAV